MTYESSPVKKNKRVSVSGNSPLIKRYLRQMTHYWEKEAVSPYQLLLSVQSLLQESLTRLWRKFIAYSDKPLWNTSCLLKKGLFTPFPIELLWFVLSEITVFKLLACFFALEITWPYRLSRQDVDVVLERVTSRVRLNAIK